MPGRAWFEAAQKTTASRGNGHAIGWVRQSFGKLTMRPRGPDGAAQRLGLLERPVLLLCRLRRGGLRQHPGRRVPVRPPRAVVRRRAHGRDHRLGLELRHLLDHRLVPAVDNTKGPY